MALQFNCPNCTGEITVRFLEVGEMSKCRACGHITPVPESAITTTAVNPPPASELPAVRTIPTAQKAPPLSPPGVVEGYIATVTLKQNELSFSRAFWIVAISLAVYQFASFLLAINSDPFGEGLSEAYQIKSEVLGIAWTLILTAITLLDIDSQTNNSAEFYRLRFSALKSHGAQALKYFLVAGSAVVLMTALAPMQTLGLGELPGYGVWISFAAVVVVAPVCEEMIFRGYLYSAMIPQFKRKRERMVINAMLFAAAHVFFVTFLFGATIPYYIFALGYLLAKLYEDSRSILPCILLHALNNGLVFALEYFALGDKIALY